MCSVSYVLNELYLEHEFIYAIDYFECALIKEVLSLQENAGARHILLYFILMNIRLVSS